MQHNCARLYSGGGKINSVKTREMNIAYNLVVIVLCTEVNY